MEKEEISIKQVKIIAKEELENYTKFSLTEDNLRKRIQEDLKNATNDILYSFLGLNYDKWEHKWKLGSYGYLSNLMGSKETIVKNIGQEMITELIKEIQPQDVLSILTQANKNELKRTYKEALMSSFKSEVKKLAEENGRKYANKLFYEYINESDKEEQINKESEMHES